MSYTPLSDQYYAGVLDFGGVRILLDCGCDIDFQNLGDKIAAVAPTVDLVLLSHAELRHVGALPAAKARYGLAAPVFATTPTIKNGALTLYEAWGGFRAAKGRAAAKELFTLDDVDAAFDKIRALKFDQPLSLRGRGAGVGARAGGHTSPGEGGTASTSKSFSASNTRVRCSTAAASSPQSLAFSARNAATERPAFRARTLTAAGSPNFTASSSQCFASARSFLSSFPRFAWMKNKLKAAAEWPRKAACAYHCRARVSEAGRHLQLSLSAKVTRSSLSHQGVKRSCCVPR